MKQTANVAEIANTNSNRGLPVKTVPIENNGPFLVKTARISNSVSQNGPKQKIQFYIMWIFYQFK